MNSEEEPMDIDTGATEPKEEQEKAIQSAKSSKKEEKSDDGTKESNEKLLRMAAEFDNYKKRVHRELEEAGTLGKATFVKEMLPMLDEFEFALIAADKSADKNLAKGIEMIYSNLMDVLKRNGLREVKAEGAFDPFRHEIMMVRESKEKEGTILEVIKKGYEISGRMIRPASVIVSKHEEKKEEKN
jgi:molecular chaperone GrpE